MQDLRDLKAKFPHVGEETIKRTYAEAFRDTARKSTVRKYLYLFAKKFAAEKLQEEHPVQRNAEGYKAERKEQGETKAKNAFFRFFGRPFAKEAEPAGTD